jgi:hypothetical protein
MRFAVLLSVVLAKEQVQRKDKEEVKKKNQVTHKKVKRLPPPKADKPPVVSLPSPPPLAPVSLPSPQGSGRSLQKASGPITSNSIKSSVSSQAPDRDEASISNAGTTVVGESTTNVKSADQGLGAPAAAGAIVAGVVMFAAVAFFVLKKKGQSDTEVEQGLPTFQPEEKSKSINSFKEALMQSPVSSSPRFDQYPAVPETIPHSNVTAPNRSSILNVFSVESSSTICFE